MWKLRDICLLPPCRENSSSYEKDLIRFFLSLNYPSPSLGKKWRESWRGYKVMTSHWEIQKSRSKCNRMRENRYEKKGKKPFSAYTFIRFRLIKKKSESPN